MKPSSLISSEQEKISVTNLAFLESVMTTGRKNCRSNSKTSLLKFISYKDARNRYVYVLSQTKQNFNNYIRGRVFCVLKGMNSIWSLSKNILENFSKSYFHRLIIDIGIISTTKEKAEAFAKYLSSNSTVENY